MVKHLDLFLPPNELADSRPVLSCSPMKKWCILLAFIGSIKAFQCVPFSFGVGSQAYAGTATEPAQREDTPLVVKKEGKKEEDKAITVNEPNPIPIGLDEMKILQALRQRSAELQSTSKAQDERQKDMNMLNEVMQKNIEELKRLKATLDEQVKAIQKEPQEALQKMAKLYDGMKPAQCAKILEDMETPIVAQIMGLMKKQVAAGVMAALSDKKARLVTLQSLQMKQQAQQQSNPPKG